MERIIDFSKTGSSYVSPEAMVINIGFSNCILAKSDQDMDPEIGEW